MPKCMTYVDLSWRQSPHVATGAPRLFSDDHIFNGQIFDDHISNKGKKNALIPTHKMYIIFDPTPKAGE